MSRTMTVLIAALVAGACVAESEQTKSPSADPGVFALGATPELHVPGTQFEIGCPDGWRYKGYGGPAGFIFFEPPKPLPGGIESFIGTFWGQEGMSIGSKPPDAPDAFLRMLVDDFKATGVEEHVGLWDGKSALWFRGRIKSEPLTSDDTQSLDGFVAAVKGATGEWNTFLIASYPIGVYEEAFSQTVGGFRPLLDSQPDDGDPLAPATGECSGSFSEAVSPPPYQPIEAFIITFNRLPTVEVTNEIECKPQPPGTTQCQFVAAVSGTLALPGRYRYRIEIWPTASATAVAVVTRRLERSPDVARFKIVGRDE